MIKNQQVIAQNILNRNELKNFILEKKMHTFIDKTGLEVLKKLVGDTIQTITSDNWKRFNRSYGNILIETKKLFLEINNDYRVVPYFGGTEELAGFQVNELKSKSDFEASVLEEKLLTEKIDREILAIRIVRDTINTIFENGKTDQYVTDHAIIFELQGIEWLIGENNLFVPMGTMIFEKDVTPKVITINHVIDDWDDDEEEEGEVPPYKVTVERQIIKI